MANLDNPAATATLDEMRKIYRYATLESHILVDGELYLRCRGCRVAPVPRTYLFVVLCDPCLGAKLAEADREVKAE